MGWEQDDEETRMYALKNKHNPNVLKHTIDIVMVRQPAPQRFTLVRPKRTAYTDPAEWEDNLTQMIQPATNIATSSCICKACGDDFKRNKPQYTPRWVKPNKVCVIPACKRAESPILC